MADDTGAPAPAAAAPAGGRPWWSPRTYSGRVTALVVLSVVLVAVLLNVVATRFTPQPSVRRPKPRVTVVPGRSGKPAAPQLVE